MVTIITPCYNASAYIKDTILSVLNQTYADWEMIIVDDCSSDNSADIIKEYLSDPRIKYFKTDRPSGGPSAPRNIGIDNAKGEYIAFLDSDDIWLPNKLESQLLFMKSRNASFAYSNYIRFKNVNNLRGVIHAPSSATYNDILHSDYIPLLTIIIKKAILGDIRFVNRSKEDFAFLLALLRTGICAFNTNDCVALYRIAKKSRSSNKLYMMFQHYKILRDENINPIRCWYYVFTHSYAAFLKYRK